MTEQARVTKSAIDAFWLPYRGKMVERTKENAFKTVGSLLLDGPFIIDEPYHQQAGERLSWEETLAFAFGPRRPNRSLKKYFEEKGKNPAHYYFQLPAFAAKPAQPAR